MGRGQGGVKYDNVPEDTILKDVFVKTDSSQKEE